MWVYALFIGLAVAVLLIIIFTVDYEIDRQAKKRDELIQGDLGILHDKLTILRNEMEKLRREVKGDERL